MDLVVRSPHGDADVSVAADLVTTTLGDIVAAVTGQAVPAIVVVDGRVLPASTALADENVRVGSVLSTVSVDQDRAVDQAIQLLQHAGRGAGSIRPVGLGRYRIGPGRRLNAPELAAAPVEQAAFELEVAGDTVTVHPVGEPPVIVDGRIIDEPTPWIGGDLVTGARVFGFQRMGWAAPAGRRNADADGTVPFARSAATGAIEERSLVDVVREATEHDPLLWRRRLESDTPVSVPIGLVDEGGPSLRRVSLTVGPGRGAAVVGEEDFVEAIARAIVLGAVTAHGPADLDVVVATSPDRVGRWDWLKWAPHVRAGCEPSILATDTALRRWADGLLVGHPTAVTLLIVDDDERWNRRTSPLREVVSSPPESLRLVVLCDRADRAPASCRTVVAQQGPLASITNGASGGSASSSIGIAAFLPSLVDPAVAAEAARSIACLVDIERDDTLVLHEPAPTPVLAETFEALTAGHSRPNSAWIGNIDVGDRVIVDWTDTSIVAVRASDHRDLDALAVSVVAGLVADHRPVDLPLLLIGDREGSTLLGLLSELPHVGGRCASGDALERRRVLSRVEHVASRGEIGIVLAGSDIDDWSTDIFALAERVPSVRVVIAQSGAVDGEWLPPRPGLVDIEVSRRAGLPQATMVRTSRYGDRDTSQDEATFTPVLASEPAPTDGPALQPLVIGRPLTSLERRLTRVTDPHPAFDETTRTLLGSFGGGDASPSAGMPILVPPPLPTSVGLEGLLEANEADAIPVGLADDAGNADFPVVWWQPGANGTWLFVGSPRAELDTALGAILRGVAERSSPDDVHIAMIDSSGRRLSMAETMPHTELVAPSDRVDLAAAVIEHVAAELRLRRAEPGVDRPGLVLLVSELTQLTRRLSDSAFASALDSLRSLGAGATHGVNVVAFASRIEGTAGFLDTAADVLVGLLTNSDEVSSLGLDELAMSVSGPGRCWSRATGLLVQLASPANPTAGPARTTWERP